MNFGSSQTAFLGLFVFGLTRSIGVNRLGVMLSGGKSRRLGVRTNANSILFLAMFATMGPIVGFLSEILRVLGCDIIKNRWWFDEFHLIVCYI